MAELRKTLETMGGHLQDLQSEQNQTALELARNVASTGQLQQTVGQLQQTAGQLQQTVGQLHESNRNLAARAVSMEASYVALNGTFASLERILTDLFADRERVAQLERQNADLTNSLTDLARRVEALERRAS